MKRMILEQAANFTSAIFLSSSPKMNFSTKTQEVTKDGVLKWTAEVVVTPRDDYAKSEVLSLTVTGAANPCEGWAPATPVVFDTLAWNRSKTKDGKPMEYFSVAGLKPSKS